MSTDNPYDTLLEHTGELDAHWAFGTGFADPLAGIDAGIEMALPADVSGSDLAGYCLMLGDDALVLSHRLQQWCTRAPELEDEVALANIALDLLGQARLLYTRAGNADGSGRDEDWFAFAREPAEFRCVQLVEPVDRDFGSLTARVLVVSAWRLALLEHLTASRDHVLAALAAKGRNEVAFHRDYAARWVVRLGDGTELSRERVWRGLSELVPAMGELFAPDPLQLRLVRAGAAADPRRLRAGVDDVLAQVLAQASLPALPAYSVPPTSAGRAGRHTAALPGLLAELQGLAREHPGARW